jgi:RNA polymerase sigma factor (sigma-70 family)
MEPSSALLLARLVDERAGGWVVDHRSEALVLALYHQEGRNLVRLARLFVDDMDAAEDLVQESFIRLARHAHRIDEDRAPAYLRSIVLNLARDHNRRGLVSLRHQSASGREVDVPDEAPERLVTDERQLAVLDAVRTLPVRQRDCVVLRYFQDLGIDDIARTLGLSPNSVKTHLKRGLAHLAERLERSR